LNKSIKIFIKWFAGPVLAAWLFYSLYQQVRSQEGLDKAIALIKAAPSGADAWKFWAMIALVFVNWGIEARKWQLLMRPLQRLSFFRAFKSVLSGVTLSLNMPNRIGEYAGRMLFVQEEYRIHTISLSIAGSVAQLIITVLMGCLGLAYLLVQGGEKVLSMELSVFWLRIFFYGSCFGVTVLLLFFFRLGWLIRLIEKLPYSDRFARYINVLETFDAKILLRLLSLSLFRYLVFVMQYIFMLQLMEVEQSVWTGFWLVAVMFWILAIIPSFAIADLGIRGTVARTLFSYSANTIGILAVTFGIWFVNLFLPAFIGSLLILGIKIKKDK
jgi:hypothetical protein